jgi:hypothetical protein
VERVYESRFKEEFELQNPYVLLQETHESEERMNAVVTEYVNQIFEDLNREMGELEVDWRRE